MKHLKRAFCALLAAAIITVLFTGCNDGADANKTSITFLNSKGEIQSALEQVAKSYEEKTGVRVEVIAAATGTSPFERISAMYNSGTPPTMAMLDATDIVTLYKEKALDLSEEKWVADAGNQIYTINGKVYSFPMGVEGKGLIYNKTAVEKALGRAFDPASINTLTKLKALFQQLSDKGLTPCVITNEDWSLGAHYLGMLYQAQSENLEDVTAYIEKLKNGEIQVASDKRFQELMDVFDLLKNNNINKSDPLASEYAMDPVNLADGAVAFWFNGNWAWTNLEDFIQENTEFGLMPVPLNDDTGDFANSILLGAASKQIMIDRVKATPEQQQAAKDFLNWFVYDADGQKAMVDSLSLVPAFSNISLQPADPLSKAIQDYVNAGKTNKDPIVPADHWSVLGEAMQRYLAGRLDRAGLAAAIENYWKNQE